MSHILDILSRCGYSSRMKTLPARKPANPTDIAKRQYKIRFWIAMGTYLVTLWPVIEAVKHAAGPWKIALSLTPLIPVAAIFIFAVQMIAGVDELERQIHLEALAIAAGVTAMLSVTYGFLEVAGLPNPSAWFTYAVVMLTWALATPFVARKYKG